jgi:hypothetical protein
VTEQASSTLRKLANFESLMMAQKVRPEPSGISGLLFSLTDENLLL